MRIMNEDISKEVDAGIKEPKASACMTFIKSIFFSKETDHVNLYNNKKRIAMPFFIFAFMFLILSLGSAHGLCQYAASASATSESTQGSFAINAVGEPDAQYVGSCGQWSGYGVTWSPSNWNVKANLTLRYDVPVSAENITVFGDYDMCISKVAVRDSSAGEEHVIYQAIDNRCVPQYNIPSGYLADTVIIETCGWGWTSTDAVELCGIENIVAVCGNGILEPGEECDDGNLIDGDGCSSNCTIEPQEPQNLEVYLVPYVGNIDGSIGSDYHYFYDMLREWHDNNSIPASFSVYPETMTSQGFNEIIGRMYGSPNAELILKGESSYNGIEMQMMDESEVLAAFAQWHNLYESGLMAAGYSNISMPKTYNQNLGRFTETIRDAIRSLGYRLYMEQYISEFGNVDTIHDFDIMQYSVSLTGSGMTGPEHEFQTPADYIQNVLDLDLDRMLYINGTKVVPMLVHAQDFRINFSSTEFDQNKWAIYTAILEMAEADPRIELRFPKDVYELRRPPLVCGNWMVDPGEECDDGNNVNGDGCSSDCRIEYGGNLAGICAWQGCSSGAASISIDDGFHPCLDKMEPYGFKATHYLNGTKNYTQQQWNIWNTLISEGHEVGAHTQEHLCNDMSFEEAHYELSTNKQDILQNTIANERDVATLAWPCGVDNHVMRSVAREYFIAARDYHINELEDQNPLEMMALKSISTPYYHGPELDPPDLNLTADLAESQGKWANFVFHDHCLEDGMIDYIATKDLWVDTIGNVVRYIITRQNTSFVSYQSNSTQVSFEVITDLAPIHVADNLSLWVDVSGWDNPILEIDGARVPYTRVIDGEGDRVRFDIALTGSNQVVLRNSSSGTGGNQTNQSICQYASFAETTSFNTNSQPSYATGPPDAPHVGTCTQWSGYGYTWSPTNWNVLANLTVHFDEPIYVSNYTLFGDYDMCWSKIWALNNATKQTQLVFDGRTNDCIMRRQLDSSFQADAMIFQTCGNSWSSTDAVQICGISQTGPVDPGCYDLDGDGFYGITASCPTGTDCDDTDPNVYPGAPETCNGKDNNCNGIIDDGLVPPPCALQQGVCEGSVKRCGGTQGWLDCTSEDYGPFYQPLEQSCSDGLDNSCNGLIDSMDPACGGGGNHTNQTSICQYASFAETTSFNTNSQPSYATGAPNAQHVGICNQWSGYGVTWSPTNWNVLANLTVYFDGPMSVMNYTLFGDYDMCWSRIWLLDNTTQQTNMVLDGIANDCIMTRPLDGAFRADAMIFQTCGWSWSSTDAVQMCGTT